MRPWRWPRVLAHRCGGVLAAENSLAGLDLAAAHGIQGVEFDAMLAACGTPVVIHDETLERTTEARGMVSKVPWSLLRGIGLRERDGRVGDERIPSLDQVLERCVALGLAANVEIKPATGYERETGAQVALRANERAGDRSPMALLSSFSTVALAEAARVAPMLPRGLLVEHVSDAAIVQARELGCGSLIANTDHLSAKKVRQAIEAGLEVAVYTENDPVRAQERMRWGIAALISDVPHRLSQGPNGPALA